MDSYRHLVSIGLLVLALPLLSCGSDEESGPAPGRTLVEDYLRSDNYTRLVLEVDYVTEKQPYDASRQAIEDSLPEIVDKPDGVEVVMDGQLAPRGSNHVWTFEELHSTGESTFDMETGENTKRIHVMFVDGSYEEDTEESKVVGLEWQNRQIAIFKDTLEEGCQSSLPRIEDVVCRSAETTIWRHEIGHVLGLVDNPIEPQSDHLDEEHGKHCDNDECVMYWTYRGTEVFRQIRGRIDEGNEDAMGFDQNCLDDLASVRE